MISTRSPGCTKPDTAFTRSPERVSARMPGWRRTGIVSSAEWETLDVVNKLPAGIVINANASTDLLAVHCLSVGVDFRGPARNGAQHIQRYLAASGNIFGGNEYLARFRRGGSRLLERGEVTQRQDARPQREDDSDDERDATGVIHKGSLRNGMSVCDKVTRSAPAAIAVA